MTIQEGHTEGCLGFKANPPPQHFHS